MDFGHLPKFTVTHQESEEWGDYVQKTAKLLKRQFYAIHAIFERERWTLEEVKTAYHNADKHHGDLPKDVYWWWKRKVRNKGVDKST